MAYLFVDTEFTNFKNMELISIGFVSEDGEHEFYRENTSHEPNFRSDFVNSVVMPLLEGGTYAKSYDWVAKDMKEWIESLPYDQVVIVCDYQGDWGLFDKLIRKCGKPNKKVIPMMLNYAFNEMLTFRGFNEKAELRFKAMHHMCEQQSEYYKTDPRQHHALVDAKSNRYGWIKGYEYAKEHA